MPLLSTAQITSMKTTANLALPDSAVITRATLARAANGGFTESWGTVATVACRIDPPGSVRLDQWSEKIQDRSPFILNLAAAGNIQSGDKATVGSEVYEVIGLMDGSWEITRRVVVVKI
jgi:hypothetical protein